jgi:hypothetical protein
MHDITYVTFLGAGFYQEVAYSWDEVGISSPTPYAQQAELELLQRNLGISSGSIRVLVFGTPTAREAHWELSRGWNPRTRKFGDPTGPGLEPRLAGMNVQFVPISEGLSPAAQWATFERLLGHIPQGARLVLDMTHGFRALPVVVSSALHFLRLTRQVDLVHVLYAAFDADPPAIVDYAAFYAIQDWTKGVSRLVEDANAARLARLAAVGSALELEGFSGQALTDALVQISDAVRNVEVHGIEGKVRAALSLVEQGLALAQSRGHTTSAILLELVQKKFAILAAEPPLSGRYEAAYFELQLSFIALLLEHRLFMQAYTAMRELIGSLGMLGIPQGDLAYTSRDGRSKRFFADRFVAMVEIERPRWRFHGAPREQVEALTPFYERLERAGLSADLRRLAREITDLRNGFDHAWTRVAGVPERIEHRGQDHLRRLRVITVGVLGVVRPKGEGSAAEE